MSYFFKFFLIFYSSLLFSSNFENFQFYTIDNKKINISKLEDKIYILFYTDLNSRKINKEFIKELKKKKYNKKKYNEILIVNTAKTIYPDFIIKNAIKNKMSKSPDTILSIDNNYIKNNKIKKNKINTFILRKDKLLYYKYGKIERNEFNKIFNIIEKNINLI